MMANTLEYNLQNIPERIVFDLCMGRFFQGDERDFKGFKPDNDEFHDLLVVNKLKKYEMLLKNHATIYNIKNQNKKLTPENFKLSKIRAIKSAISNIDLLLFLMENTNVNISLTSLTDFKIKIESRDLKLYVEDALKERLKLTFSKGYKIPLEDINLESLKLLRVEKETEIKSNPIKKGAHEKNHFLVKLVFRLSYLYRFEEFMLQDKIDTIYNYKLSRASHRFVYDFLKIFQMTDVVLTKENDEYKADYIKSMLNQRKDILGDYDYNDKKFKLESNIDLLWKIKHKDIQLSEEEEKRLSKIFNGS